MNWNTSVYSLMALIFCGVKIIDSANILVVIPVPAHSHLKSFQPLWEELVKRGHNLTLIAGHKLSNKFQYNYTFMDLKPYFGELNIEYAEMRKQNRLENFMFCHDVLQDYSEVILKLPQIQDIINSDNEYDLVVGEMFFVDTFFAFGYKFNAPVIAFSSQTLISQYSWILGNPFPASYIPNSFLSMTEKMSLADRILNTAFDLFTVFFYEFVSLPRSQSIIEKYFHFDKRDMPHIKNIMKNISVTFVNSHYSFGYIKPELPNVVNLAGLHFTPLKSLPKNIQDFMDEAKHGVVYVSLGSLIEPEKVENLGETFIRVLGKIQERVIMKWNSKLLSHIPSNILVQEWIPQVEVLNHPNCRLFITHGGLHSLFESLNASVPLIGIPFFSDQKFNMAVVEYYGIGVTLESENTAEELSSRIKQVLHDSKYKKNIEKRSQLFRERLTYPLETAVYWVEHVIQHKNTAHLKPSSSQLYWFELYSLDVIAIFVASIWVFVKIVKLIVGKIIKKSVSAPSKKYAMNNNNISSQKEKVMNKNFKYD